MNFDFEGAVKRGKHYAGLSCSRQHWTHFVSQEVPDEHLRNALEYFLHQVLDNHDLTYETYCRVVISRGGKYTHCGRGAAHIGWNPWCEPEIRFPLCPGHARDLESGLIGWVLKNRPHVLRDHGLDPEDYAYERKYFQLQFENRELQQKLAVALNELAKRDGETDEPVTILKDDS